MPIFTARMTSLKLEDGTGTPLSVTLTGYKSFVSVKGIMNGGKEAIDIDDRGDFLERVWGKESDVEMSAEIFHDGDLTDGTVKKLVDAILGQGAWASAVSRDTNAGTGGPLALKATVTITRRFYRSI